jgi:hypothetical protein
MLVGPPKLIPLPYEPLQQIQFVVILMSPQGKLSHFVIFDICIISLLLSSVLINYLSTLLFILSVFNVCFVYFPLSFVSVCRTLLVAGDQAVDSAH